MRLSKTLSKDFSKGLKRLLLSLNRKCIKKDLILLKRMGIGGERGGPSYHKKELCAI